MDNQYEESSISIAEIWDKLWFHKILVLVITGVITILLTLCLYFVFKGQQVTVTNFEYNFVNVEANKFADGSTFEFRDLVSYDKLLKVKQSKALYNDINVEEMYQDKNTQIVRQLSPYTTASEVIYTDNQFSLSIPFKYFGHDQKIALSFIKDLLNSVILEAIQKDINLRIYNYVDLVDNSVEYLDAVDYYLEQYNLLLGSINSFIESYGDVTFNGLNITDMREKIESAYANTYTYDEITTLIKKEAYYKNVATLTDKLELRISNIERSIELNVLRINELETMYKDLVEASNLQQAEVLLTRIADYRIENVNFQFEIDEYQKIIDQADASGLAYYNSRNFLDIINDIETFLNDNTDDFNDFYVAFMDNNTEIIYENGSVFIIDGGQNMIVLAILSGMIGLVSSFVVVFIKESAYSIKKKQEMK